MSDNKPMTREEMKRLNDEADAELRERRAKAWTEWAKLIKSGRVKLPGRGVGQ